MLIACPVWLLKVDRICTGREVTGNDIKVSAEPHVGEVRRKHSETHTLNTDRVKRYKVDSQTGGRLPGIHTRWNSRWNTRHHASARTNHNAARYNVNTRRNRPLLLAAKRGVIGDSGTVRFFSVFAEDMVYE